MFIKHLFTSHSKFSLNVPRIEEKQVKMENNDTKNKLIFIFFTRLS